MNISDLNNKIYGNKDLKQGEYANSIIESIQQKEIQNVNFKDYNNDSNQMNKELKF